MGSIPAAGAAKPANLINLQLGWPTARLCAVSGILNGAQEVLTSQEESAKALIYGAHAGHPPLRQSVADWLSTIYPRNIDSKRMCISNGASANLSNVLLKFTDPSYTRRVFMIEPTYFLACPIFEDNGLQGKLRGVPEDDEGVDIAFLRQELEHAEAEVKASLEQSGSLDQPRFKTGKSYPKIYKHIIYVVPTFSNPSGMTMSLSRRKELVALAREYDALVISDDVYDFLSWPEDPSAPKTDVGPVPPRLVDIDEEMEGGDQWGNTLSNGSFSKIIGPGVRVGWSESTTALASELAEVGSSSSGGAPSHLMSTFVDKMLRSGQLQSHIQDVLIPTYRERYGVLIRSINNLLVPLGVKISSKLVGGVAGGFFTYLSLPDDMPVARTVASAALNEQNLRVAFGHMFMVAGDDSSISRAEAAGGFARSIRLCWAWHEEEDIQEGIQRLENTILGIRAKLERGEAISDGKNIGIR